MADDTVAVLATELANVFEPLEQRLASGNVIGLFTELGLVFPASLAADAGISGALTQAVNSVTALPPLITQLENAITADDVAQIITAVAKLIQAIGQALTAIDSIASAINSAAGSFGGLNPADVTAFAGQLADALFGYVVTTYLQSYYPRLHACLALFGVVEETPENTTSTDPNKPPYVLRRIHLDALSNLFSKPMAFLQSEYGWNTPTFDGKLLLQRGADVLYAFAVPAAYNRGTTTTPPSIRVLLLSLTPNAALSPPGLRLALEIGLTDGFTVTFPFFMDGWSIQIVGKGALATGLAVDIAPPSAITLVPPSGTVEGSLWFNLVGAPVAPATTLPIFNAAGSIAVQVGGITAGIGADFSWDAANNHATGEMAIQAGVSKGQVVIKASDADSFLASLLPPDGLTADFDFTVGWSGSKGVYFTGSAGLETTIALNLSIGPLSIPTLYVAIDLTSAGQLSLEASVAAQGTIGPISASVDRIGALATLAFHKGNLGPVDLSIGFKPPTGLGLSIDAGPITGGGFISYDPPSGRYSGILSLSLYGISITAIGLLDTKLPNGQSGYSFLIIISVTFTPIQLSFGFTLNGVGGLCGVNRTMITDAIQAGLKTGSIADIMFPPDPIADAPQIISELSTIFPPAVGQYVFGPILQLGWGTPTLITAELGVIIELPNPIVIAILGQLDMALPTADAPLIEIHVDVLGVLDFEKQLFEIIADIYDSRVVTFTISGGMALMLTWGDDANFVFSIGGFNPHYQPPPSFPSVDRITLALGLGDDLRLTLQAYLAVTTNSFQIGAHLELYMGISSFNIDGWLGFDALIIFSPFSFLVNFTAGLALRSGTSVIMGISVDGTLSGPTPWHAEGNASISILFFSISAHVSFTIGSAQSNPLPSINAWQPLQAAIQLASNWTGVLPADVQQIATLSPPEKNAAPILIDPSGALTFQQKVLPLNQPLDKVGNAVPAQQNEFDLTGVTLGGNPVPYTIVPGEFAPGQYRNLSDGDKLSLPSFAPMDAGFSVGDGAVDFGKLYAVNIEYETTIIDRTRLILTLRYQMTRDDTLAWAKLGAAAQAPLRTTGLAASMPDPRAPKLVAMTAEQYVIASTVDLTARTDIVSAGTKGDAFAALSAHLAQNPADRGTLQVIPLYELAA